MGISAVNGKIEFNLNITMKDVCDGYNVTLLSYGQIGAGKTYTMFGPESTGNSRGIVYRILEDLFKKLSTLIDIQIEAKLQFLELYKEKVYDLLDRNFLILLFSSTI